MASQNHQLPACVGAYALKAAWGRIKKEPSLKGAYKVSWVSHLMQLLPATSGNQCLLSWSTVSLAGMAAGHGP